MIVDTATLAESLGVPTPFVYRLADAQIIPVAGRPRLGRMGRPTMWFDLDAAHDAFDAARASGRVAVDQNGWALRK